MENLLIFLAIAFIGIAVIYFIVSLNGKEEEKDDFRSNNYFDETTERNFRPRDYQRAQNRDYSQGGSTVAIWIVLILIVIAVMVYIAVNSDDGHYRRRRGSSFIYGSSSSRYYGGSSYGNSYGNSYGGSRSYSRSRSGLRSKGSSFRGRSYSGGGK